MNNYVAQVLLDLFADAQNGKVVIGKEDSEYGAINFDTHFFVKTNDLLVNNALVKSGETGTKEDDKAVISIPDFNAFVACAIQYLEKARNFYSEDKSYWLLENDDYAFDKKLLLDLFVNCSINDFNSIQSYVQTRTNMLKTPLKSNEMFMGEFNGLKIKSKILKNHAFMESPYTFDSVLISPDGAEYRLPSMYFGVDGDTVYLYAIKHKKVAPKNTQKPKEKQTIKEQKDAELHKKLDRYLRKVNKGVNVDEQMLVAPNAIVGFTIFAEYLKNNGLFKIINPSFMPIRYQGKRDSVANRLTTQEEKEAWVEEYDGIQHNVTNKLIDTLYRYAYFFEENSCYYDDMSTNTYIKLAKTKSLPKFDNIIYDIAQSVSNAEKTQKINI